MPSRAIEVRRMLGAAVSFLLLASLLALFFAYRQGAGALHAPPFKISILRLPYYAFCSFYRMLAAYALALIFSIVYGLYAARSKAYERIMIPAIDIAQSVPVVGFFPAAIYFFVVVPVNAVMARARRGEAPPDPTIKQCAECLSTIPIQARRCAFCTSPVA